MQRSLLRGLCLPANAVADLLLQGVGSHAAHLLLRSGVRKLRLIDFDQVSLSSLNRHALATRADVGMPKATCLRVRPLHAALSIATGVVR